jgi:hypothetical protein
MSAGDVHRTATVLQGKMEDFMKKQAAGYVNWKATITDKVSWCTPAVLVLRWLCYVVP